jgi:hypothetical protein
MTEVKEIQLDAVVSHSPGIVVGDMDGEKVMLNIEEGKYYALDRIGSRIWELVETPRTVEDLVAVLVGEYDVEKDKCQYDVLALLNQLYAQGLVAVG